MCNFASMQIRIQIKMSSYAGWDKRIENVLHTSKCLQWFCTDLNYYIGEDFNLNINLDLDPQDLSGFSGRP